MFYRRCDVTRKDEIDATVAFCKSQFGKLDILVNNAGILQRIDVFDITPEIWTKTMDVNLGAFFFCAQSAARLMRETNGGSIVNLASVSADVVHPNLIPYSTSKGGIRTLTYGLAVALGK